MTTSTCAADFDDTPVAPGLARRDDFDDTPARSASAARRKVRNDDDPTCDFDDAPAAPPGRPRAFDDTFDDESSTDPFADVELDDTFTRFDDEDAPNSRRTGTSTAVTEGFDTSDFDTPPAAARAATAGLNVTEHAALLPERAPGHRATTRPTTAASGSADGASPRGTTPAAPPPAEKRFHCGMCGKPHPVSVSSRKNGILYCHVCAREIPTLSIGGSNTYNPDDPWAVE